MESNRIDELIEGLAHHLGSNGADGLKAELEFVRLLLRERAERKAMWQRVKQNTIGWMVIAVLTSVGSAGYHVLQLVINNWHSVTQALAGGNSK